MHPGSTRSANEVVEIANLDALHALVDTGHDEVSNRKVYALRQGRGANNESHKVITHGMLHRQPDTMRSIAMMGENAMCRALGRRSVSTEILDVQIGQPLNFLSVRKI